MYLHSSPLRALTIFVSLLCTASFFADAGNTLAMTSESPDRDVDPASSFWLKNAHATVWFSSPNNGMGVVSLASAGTKARPAIRTMAHTPLLWELQLVGEVDAVLTVDNTAPSVRSAAKQDTPDALVSYTLTWSGVQSPSDATPLCNVTVTASLAVDSSFVEMRISVDLEPASGYRLWDTTFPSLSEMGTADATLYIPLGFGAAYPLSDVTQAKTLEYPGADATMQFMALTVGKGPYQSCDTTGCAGAYVAAHDGTGSVKYLDAVPGPNHGVKLGIRHAPGGVPLLTYTSAYPVAVGAFVGGWYEAAQVYRPFVFSSAEWIVNNKPVSQRGYESWYTDTALWLNSGWQPVDIFNATQGDPDVVLARMHAMRKRFGVPLALHWYVWSKNHAFDMGLPDYFPAKDGFVAAVKELKAAGVSTLPYINGRCFDITIPMWDTDHAERFATQKVDAPTLDPQAHLVMNQETYGSGVAFAPMCPATTYWQAKIAGVVSTLVDDYAVSGVYIDQVGAAAPPVCLDASHGHPVGGGGWWRQGYVEMMRQTERSVKGAGAVTVTEDNAETFLDLIDGFLTLVPFNVGEANWAPMYHAVYSGWYVPFGAGFLRSQLNGPDGPAPFVELVVRQFLHGAQMGWMSLGGTNDNPPMGMFEDLMNPAYDAEVALVSTLARVRVLSVPYLLYGRMLAPTYAHTATGVTLATTVYKREVAEGGDGSVGVFAVNTDPKASVTVSLPVNLWAFAFVQGHACVVERWSSDGTRAVVYTASASERTFTIPDLAVESYGVLVLVFKAATTLRGAGTVGRVA